MAYDSLKAEIRQYIKTNGQNEITGQILQDVLIDMVNNYPSLDGYLHPTINNLGTGDIIQFNGSAWVNTPLSSALSAYATHSWVESLLNGYATQSWVLAQGYITSSGSCYSSTYSTYATYATYASDGYTAASQHWVEENFIQSLSLAGLTDVDISGETEYEVLYFDDTLNKWVNGFLPLSQLEDVNISNLSQGQVLMFSTGNTWMNKSLTLDNVADGTTRRLADYMPNSTAVVNGVTGDDLGRLTLTGNNFTTTILDLTHQHRWEEIVDRPAIDMYDGTSVQVGGLISDGSVIIGGTNANGYMLMVYGKLATTDNAAIDGNISCTGDVSIVGDMGVNDVTANSFIKDGGTSAQFLKADGSVDTNAYITSTALSGYATQSWVSSNYATQSTVNGLSYINGLALNTDGNINVTGHSFTTTILDLTHQHRWEDLIDRPAIDMWNDTMISVGGIVSSGKIGAGVSSAPSYMLEVNGQTMLYYNVGIGTSPASGYSLDIDGSARASSFVNNSDIRKKDVIEYDVAPGFEEVVNAPTIRFTWKQPGRMNNRGECVGSIAQYWRNAIPEAVVEDADGYLSMQYDVIALLSCVSVAKKVADNELRISALEQENALLRMELKALKAS